MDKHLLAQNPLRPESGGICIIRTIAPIGVFEVIHGHVFFDISNYHKAFIYHKHFSYYNKEYTLKLHYYGGFKEPAPTQDEALEMAIKHIDDAWYWYMSVLKEQENGNK